VAVTDPEVERKAKQAAHAVAATSARWLARLTGCVRLHRTEFSDNPLLRLLDQFGFTDYIGETAQKGLRRIAMRAQFRPLLFASHTIREELPSGAPTELAKLLSALSDDPQQLPSLHVQIYASEDGTEFIGGASVRSVPFVQWLSGAWDRLESRYSPEKFRIAWWRQMRSAGLAVECLGESRLQDRLHSRAGPYQYFSKAVIYGPCPGCGMATAIGFKGERSFPAPTECTRCRAGAINAVMASAPYQETGPCARCQTPCTRYGPHGSPLCGDCRALARAPGP
jgi:hypothetical protein